VATPGLLAALLARGSSTRQGLRNGRSRLRNGPVGLGLDGLPGTTRGPAQRGAFPVRRHGYDLGRAIGEAA
jgi:hypothetical protein